MYQSAEFITDLIFETESMDISDPESPLTLPWESYKNHFAGDREASNTQLMLVRLQKLER